MSHKAGGGTTTIVATQDREGRTEQRCEAGRDREAGGGDGSPDPRHGLVHGLTWICATTELLLAPAFILPVAATWDF